MAAEEIAERAPTLERGEAVVAAQRRLELAEEALSGVLRRMPRDLRGMGRYQVLSALEERIAELWDEQRAARATLRNGDRELIIQRARQEERLSRAA